MPATKTNIVTSTQFGQIFSEFKPRFISIAYRYVRDAETAQDIVSDSFMAFWEIRDTLPDDVNVPAYILTIVKNRCLNHLNAELRHLRAEKNIHTTQKRLLQADIRSLSACDPDLLFSGEIGQMLERAIAKMPPMTRSVFMNSRYEGLTYKEIAAKLGISVSHVNFEIRRALDILRVELKDYLPAVILALWIYPKF